MIRDRAYVQAIAEKLLGGVCDVRPIYVHSNAREASPVTGMPWTERNLARYFFGTMTVYSPFGFSFFVHSEVDGMADFEVTPSLIASGGTVQYDDLFLNWHEYNDELNVVTLHGWVIRKTV